MQTNPKDRALGEKVALQAKRMAIRQLNEEHQMSEHRACRHVALSREIFRNAPVPNVETEALGAKNVETALVRRRFSYRCLHDPLRQEFPRIDHEGVYRLYRPASLAVRTRKKIKRRLAERTPLNIATEVNAVGSMDFVSDSLAKGLERPVLPS